jgi:hypothetical protein
MVTVHPLSEIHPVQLKVLQGVGLGTEGLRSKSWDALDTASAMEFEILFAVSDSAAGVTCPSRLTDRPVRTGESRIWRRSTSLSRRMLS